MRILPLLIAALLIGFACAVSTDPPAVDRVFVGDWTFTIYAPTESVRECQGEIAFHGTGPGAIEGNLTTYTNGCASSIGDFTGTLSEDRISIAVVTGCEPQWSPLRGTLVDGLLEVDSQWTLICPNGRVDYGIAFTGSE